MSTAKHNNGLILGRMAGQSVIIAEGEIVVTVLEVRGDKVRLSFKAPSDIPIDRQEVYHAKQQAETAKANSSRGASALVAGQD